MTLQAEDTIQTSSTGAQTRVGMDLTREETIGQETLIEMIGGQMIGGLSTMTGMIGGRRIMTDMTGGMTEETMTAETEVMIEAMIEAMIVGTTIETEIMN